MHPVLRQMKPLAATMADYGNEPHALGCESEGLVRLTGGAAPESHPRVQMKREASEAYVPDRNVLRESEELSAGEPETARHLRFEAGRTLRERHSAERVLDAEDFEVDERTGVSPASAHLRAADLVTAYEQTVKEEVNFQTTFNNNVRTLISRETVAMGLMHLWDFVEAYIGNPSSKALTAQLFLIAQHSRDEGVLREALLTIAEPDSRWLVDLLSLLQTIVVQERSLSLSEKVAAINYSIFTLSRHYARKIYKSVFVPIDKEAKINTFYMRMVVKLLVLADDLGMYRNERIERVVSSTRRRELSDKELMFSLQRALAGHEDSELDVIDEGDEDEDLEGEEDDGADGFLSLQQQPQPRGGPHQYRCHEREAQSGEARSVAGRVVSRRPMVRFP